ncbi:hypothetical protein ACFFQW_36345 [Umezawaea endophytica]|uniref:Uncharacterized protein n=1 Tax=Umezawaea endophytica TaxID=1654476 RepID=A0A9X2VMU8_9PSEU|nr:hypothetical protein [Umezawaea endophytica]MCS7478927.1 hypothetical protein [Umezawaea endophytica]
MTASKLMPLALGLFALGLVAIVVVFVLFAAGRSDLPVWLNVAAWLLTPVGLAVGVVSVVRSSRSKRR